MLTVALLQDFGSRSFAAAAGLSVRYPLLLTIRQAAAWGVDVQLPESTAPKAKPAPAVIARAEKVLAANSAIAGLEEV